MISPHMIGYNISSPVFRRTRAIPVSTGTFPVAMREAYHKHCWIAGLALLPAYSLFLPQAPDLGGVFFQSERKLCG
jgi:hypothetical protein